MKTIGIFLGEPVIPDVPLRSLTSFRVGGPAEAVAFPRDTTSLSRLLAFVKQEGISYFLLGNGTNVLFDDDGFRGLIIALTKIKSFSLESCQPEMTFLTAQGGMPLGLVVCKACRLGLTGMEPFWGIPGSVGGSIACNAGSGGSSLGDVVAELTLLDRDGHEIKLKKGDFSYGYRFCNLPGDSVVLEASFQLFKKSASEIMEDLKRFRNMRRLTQPRGFPSGGCVFKNPSNDLPAGALIEKLGFKGVIEGGAEVSSVHANFIINRYKAKARDILLLIEKIMEKAYVKAGIKLEPEIKIIRSHG